MIKSFNFAKWNSIAVVLTAHATFLFMATSVELKNVLRSHHAENANVTVKVKLQKATRPVKRQIEKKISKTKAKSKVQQMETPKEIVQQENRSLEMTSQGQNSILSKYTSEIKTILDKNKFYPLLAKRMGHRGLVEANFILDRDGKVQKILNIESKYQTLGRAVKELILQKASFPPFPKELTQKSMDITVPINFEI